MSVKPAKAEVAIHGVDGRYMPVPGMRAALRNRDHNLVAGAALSCRSGHLTPINALPRRSAIFKQMQLDIVAWGNKIE